jgi:hypothetical protein
VPGTLRAFGDHARFGVDAASARIRRVGRHDGGGLHAQRGDVLVAHCCVRQPRPMLPCREGVRLCPRARSVDNARRLSSALYPPMHRTSSYPSIVGPALCLKSKSGTPVHSPPNRLEERSHFLES